MVIDTITFIEISENHEGLQEHLSVEKGSYDRILYGRRFYNQIEARCKRNEIFLSFVDNGLQKVVAMAINKDWLLSAAITETPEFICQKLVISEK